MDSFENYSQFQGSLVIMMMTTKTTGGVITLTSGVNMNTCLFYGAVKIPVRTINSF